jgi:hypothetical protein
MNERWPICHPDKGQRVCQRETRSSRPWLPRRGLGHHLIHRQPGYRAGLMLKSSGPPTFNPQPSVLVRPDGFAPPPFGDFAFFGLIRSRSVRSRSSRRPLGSEDILPQPWGSLRYFFDSAAKSLRAARVVGKARSVQGISSGVKRPSSSDSSAAEGVPLTSSA